MNNRNAWWKPRRRDELEGADTVPKSNTYAYWAGLGIALGSITTSVVNGIVFLASNDPLLAMYSGLGAGLVIAVLVPLFLYPSNLT